MKKEKSIKSYIDNRPPWKESLQILRDLFDSTRLTGTIKWGMPVYTLDNKNVAGFGAFRSYAGIWFYQGVFLKDTHHKLVNAQEGVTRAQRQWRFGSADEIRRDGDLILSYLEEAISNQEQGKEIRPRRKKTEELPDEMRKVLLQNREFKKKFLSLSAAQRREYLEYLNGAKKAGTKLARLERIMPMILEGKGLNDRYR